MPGTAGEEQLAFGSAALRTAKAAQIKVCLPFRVLASRTIWLAVVCLCFASLARANEAPARASSSSSETPSNGAYLITARLDLNTLETITEDHTHTVYGDQEPQPAGQQPQTIIERIEFIGNRRIRSDTLKARIFSRDGDVYNEETLRRDFQALWNTQFFEDVKLRVEDSPDRANGNK